MSEKEANYISLKEATKYCQYSQEYLSLRARQGKLKATKIGRNWATTKEWVKEYEKRMEAYKKGEEYNPKKKKKKKEKKKDKKIKSAKRYFNLKDYLVLLLSGVIIGIVISSLVINLILIYNFSGLGLEAQKNIQKEGAEFGKRINQLSYEANKVSFNNLKILQDEIKDKNRKLKKGLSYAGSVFENIITRKTYQVASKVGKIELAFDNTVKQRQLAKVTFSSKKEKILKIKEPFQNFIYSFAFYVSSLTKNTEKVLAEKVLKLDKKIRQFITKSNLDINLNTVKFMASMESIHESTNLLEEYSKWLLKN